VASPASGPRVGAIIKPGRRSALEASTMPLTNSGEEPSVHVGPRLDRRHLDLTEPLFNPATASVLVC
jgi:hypothetical protein